MGNCMSSTKTIPEASTSTTKRTKQTKSTNTAKPNNATKITNEKPKVSSKGHVLGNSNAPNVESSADEKLDPREAARKAAEERYRSNLSKQGKLGQKLHQERSKSAQAHLQEANKEKKSEKNNEKLIYD